MQRVNPLALEWARPLTRMRAPSHGRTSGYLAKRGPGLSPCFGDRPRRAVQPLAHHPQNARLLPTGQGVRLRSASACHPLRGGFGPTPPGILLLPEQGEEECKTPAIRRSTGLSCAEAALRTAGRTRAAWCHSLHARKEAATPGPAAVCGAVWQWAASQPVRARTHVFTHPRFPWVWTPAGREPWPTLLGGRTHRRERFCRC